MRKHSPMMEQYLTIKSQHPDKILFFQVGDFYEVFFDDAPVAAREMEIALTSRDGKKENAIPLAGIPIHAADSYLNKLLARGYKVAVCDQIEEASLAKGLVKRAVTRILTPGTVTDPEMLEEGRNNYLVAVERREERYFGLAAVDVSTGDFRVTEIKGESAWEKIADELQRLQPAECVCSDPDLGEILRPFLRRRSRGLVNVCSPVDDTAQVKDLIVSQWGQKRWDELALERYPLAAAAAASALNYLFTLQHPAVNRHFQSLEHYFPGLNMIIDSITSRNLELTQTLRDGDKQGSLLGLLDRCQTAMGRRLLRRWVEQPLIDEISINDRLDAVEELLRNPLRRREAQRLFNRMLDLERFCSRLYSRRVSARDLIALRETLLMLKPLQEIISGFVAPYLVRLAQFPSFIALTELIEGALVSDPPLSLREGSLFREGYHPEADRLRKFSLEGRSHLLALEKRERERTGIKSLKLGFNRNFGYFFEVTRTNLDQVPAEYFRRQTLVNAERFVTEELKEMEEQITGSRDRLAQLEFELFEELREKVAAYSAKLQVTAQRLAALDCLHSLAETAERQRYCRPRMNPAGKHFLIEQGRHPVVEQMTAERFVPNDIRMSDNGYVLVITGPNMAGKSTYIRSAALVCVMAQMGSFVPAASAELPVLDRIFARVGASDDLSRGYSTFMVEMQETAQILREATPRSLLVLDEIGRGTSTYDGMSIARSVVEYISRTIRARTLFSTHYHELTRLEGELPGVRNYTMAVKEKGREVIFLRQVVRGRSDKSYGINVARLAGIPVDVIIRAEAILAEMEVAASKSKERQLSLLPILTYPEADNTRQAAVLEEIKELDLNRLTPLEALEQLFLLQQKLLEGDKETGIAAGGAADGD